MHTSSVKCGSSLNSAMVKIFTCGFFGCVGCLFPLPRPVVPYATRAQVLQERVGTEFLHFFHSRNSVPFAGLEQPSHPSQSFTKRRCPARVTVRGRRTLVILYVTGCFLYMDSLGKCAGIPSLPRCHNVSNVFKQVLSKSHDNFLQTSAMSPGNNDKSSQETLPHRGSDGIPAHYPMNPHTGSGQ